MQTDVRARSWALPSGLAAAGRARELVREALDADHSASVLDVAVLLVTELVTNAVRHGAPPVHLRVEDDGRRVHVGVRDGSGRTPVQRRPAADDPGGRGVLLVDLLSLEWGVEQGARGKTVWFVLDESAPPPHVG